MLFTVILILALISNFFIPFWWAFVPIAFLCGFFFGRSSFHAFGSGFLAICSLWLIIILYISIRNDNRMASRMASFLALPHWSLLILLTSILGGVLGGCGALCGRLTRQAVNSNKKQA